MGHEVRHARRWAFHPTPIQLQIARRAAEEAAKYNKVNIAATSKANKFTSACGPAQQPGPTVRLQYGAGLRIPALPRAGIHHRASGS